MPDEPLEVFDSASTSGFSFSTAKEERKDIILPVLKTPLKASTISPPCLPPNLKDIDDDDKIELILLDVQTEQSRVQEILTKLQQYGKELLELK